MTEIEELVEFKTKDKLLESFLEDWNELSVNKHFFMKWLNELEEKV